MGKRLCIVYGNCQADALRRTLLGSPEFARTWTTARLPGVHEVESGDVPALRRLFGRADLVITQQVRDDYRQLPLGTAQVLAHVPASAQVLRYPSMYYEGLHPYHVYVHATGELGTPAPLTEGYHDLRHLYAASRGWDLDDAAAWLREFVGDATAVTRMAQTSLEQLIQRGGETDGPIGHVVSALGGASFHTVNHPSNRVLHESARALDCTTELLGLTRAPVDPTVLRALGHEVEDETPGWTVNGRRIGQQDVLAAHLEFYARRPEVVATGLEEHRARMEPLGLA
jgi:hypothetical protein